MCVYPGTKTEREGGLMLMRKGPKAARPWDFCGTLLRERGGARTRAKQASCSIHTHTAPAALLPLYTHLLLSISSSRKGF